VNAIAAFLAQRKDGSSNNGDQVRKSMLIMRNAIETVGRCSFTCLENLRHRAHINLRKDVSTRNELDRAQGKCSCVTTRC
jgi:hypothetical protein